MVPARVCSDMKWVCLCTDSFFFLDLNETKQQYQFQYTIWLNLCFKHEPSIYLDINFSIGHLYFVGIYNVNALKCH